MKRHEGVQAATTDHTPDGKTCPACGEQKPASEWYRNRTAADGLASCCAACTRSRIQKKRAEMGDDAWLARQRDITANHRARTGNLRGKQLAAAYWTAVVRLRAAHPAEYDQYVTEAKQEQGL